VWLLQSSSNLTSWTEIEALKIHNGSFQRGIPRDAAMLFSRAYYDAARQNIFQHDGKRVGFARDIVQLRRSCLAAELFYPTNSWAGQHARSERHDRRRCEAWPGSVLRQTAFNESNRVLLLVPSAGTWFL
jgi:hypothetical protein